MKINNKGPSKKKTTKQLWICKKLNSCGSPDCGCSKPHKHCDRCGRFCSADPAGYDTCRPLGKGEELVYAY